MGLFDNLFGRGSSDAKLQDSIFNLKFTAKTLARTAKKCEAEEKANKTKVRGTNGIRAITRDPFTCYCAISREECAFTRDDHARAQGTSWRKRFQFSFMTTDNRRPTVNVTAGKTRDRKG